MKTHFESQPVHRGGVSSVQSDFQIKSTSKAFDILSSALYSDKIGAIVRELSCNAYDSHVAAGKRDVPIEIRLPSYLDMTFYVKDQGTGLTDFQVRGGWQHETGRQLSLEEGDEESLITGVDGWSRVGGIYNTYFESTKTDSDDYIGQLGLGSKSPFSYVTTFNVNVVKDGVERLYVCFKNEENKPSITLMGQQPSQEHNGVQITIAVRRDDIDKFNDAAQKHLMYFTPTPKVIGRSGFRPHKLSHTVSGTNWKIRTTDYHAFMSGPYVVQGFVAYPIDAYQLEQVGLTSMAKAMLSVDIDLFVPIGKVEVAASREALSYDRRTIVNLIASIEDAALELRATFQKALDTCTTAWNAAQMLDRFDNAQGEKMNAIFKKLHNDRPFQWNGADATTVFTLDMQTINNTHISRIVVKKTKHTTRLNVMGEWNPLTSAKSFEFNLNDNTLVLIADVHKGYSRTICEWLAQQPVVNNRTASVILIYPRLGAGRNQAEVEAVIQMLGKPPTTDVATLPMPTVAPSPRSGTAVRRATGQRLVFVGFPESSGYSYRHDNVRRVFSRLTWKSQDINISDGGFFVVLDRFTPSTTTDADPIYLDKILQNARKLGFLKPTDRVVGMTEKELKSIDKLDRPKWADLFVYLTDAFNSANQNGEMFSRSLVNDLFSCISSGIRQHLVNDWTRIGPTVSPGLFKSAVEDLSTAASTADKHDPDIVSVFAAHLGTGERVSKFDKSKLVTQWQEVLNTYEMLGYTNFNDYSNSWVQPVVNYVNQMEVQWLLSDPEKSITVAST